MTDVDEAKATDDELVSRLRGGDLSAVDDVFTLYGPQLLAVARRILKDGHEAQDVLQDASIMAFRAFSKFDGRSKLSTWLYRIVVNAALLRLRKKSYTNEKPMGELVPSFQDDGHRQNHRHWGSTPESRLEKEELRELVLRSISQLPDKFRDIILLRDIEELNTEQTAQVLGLSLTNTKVRLHRARQALREFLDPHLGEQAS